MATLKKTVVHWPAASELKATGLRPVVLMRAFELSQTRVPVTFVTAAPPTLQTFTPTGKMFGPEVTSLLSRPMTLEVAGSYVSAAKAVRAPTRNKRAADIRARAPTRDR